MENNSELIIGPLRYTYAVQKINVQERKSATIMETTRTNKNYIDPTGDASNTAQVRLLFTGLDEINRGISDKEDSREFTMDHVSGLRGLIALFKCAPIISIKNDVLSTLWQETVSTDEPITNNDGTEGIQKRIYKSPYIPVAITSLELENVPDMVHAIQATIGLSRVDITPVSTGNTVRYLGKDGFGEEDPLSAYWLKTWIDKIVNKNRVPEISRSDFDNVSFSWYSDDPTNIEKSPESFEFSITTKDDSLNTAIVLGESCSISHRFAFNTMDGHTYPYAQHMGSTSRVLTMDVTFHNQKNYDLFSSFSKFKELSDKQIRSDDRFDRIVGWAVKSPIAKLLSSKQSVFSTRLPGEGLYTPIIINTESSNLPNMVNTRLVMLENNADFITSQDFVDLENVTDYSLLKSYYDKLLDNEYKFRAKLATDKNAALDALLGEDSSHEYKSYQVFWPIEKGIIEIKYDSKFGILNEDTLRAAILYKSIDEDGVLKDKLRLSIQTAGDYLVSERPKFSNIAIENAAIIGQAFFGVYKNGPINSVREQIIRIVDNEMFSDTVPDDIRTLLVDNLLSSFLGNREGALQSTKLRASEVIKAISKSNLNLSTKFKDALYSVIVKRGGKPSGLEYVYSTDGIYSAFYKLITNYSLEKEAAFNLKTLPELKSEAAKELARRNLTSLYPDILLPTYVELFGEEWRDHAPTLDDIGLVVETPNDDPASGPVVSENDIVSPAAWFYKKRTKSELKDRAKLCSQAINKAKGDLSVSIPFNTSEIEEIKRELQKLNEQDLNPDLGMSGVRSTTALDEIIETALERYRDTDPLGFKKDVEDILSSADRFNAKLQSDGANLKFYIHNNGSFGIHKTVNIPGLGAEIYRILAEKKQLYSPRLPVLEQDADSQYVSSTDKNIVFHRNLSENTEKLIRSSLNQIPDDFFSAERLFPAVKVFLVDRRGNDLFPGDILYSLDNIISIDITMDKNDAQLAVIKVADPLFSLQQDFFDKLTSNVRYDESNHPKYVLSNLRDEQSVTKRYRIAQGRAVQIRMGYGSMAYNLPITFTGKITEIIPGDQLTIIAQGWKAELMTRQVNFYNDDPKNWGARDLAVQAISYASPAGFGDYFSELDTRTILNGIDPQNVSDVISNSLYNGTNNDLENQGSRSYVSEGVNWLRRLIGLRSSDKKNRGLDTRLKNIWYPDTQLYNNVLGLSSWGVMPSWQNDSWIVPLQPAWDVLQQAASHAWNCVIDVVPYDTEATIFMGHPDQPYIYTRGSAVLNAYNNKINKAQYKDLDNTLQTLLDGFVRSSYYQTTYLLNRDVIAHEFSKMAYGPAPTDADGFTLTDRTRIEQAFIKAIDGTDVLGYFRSLRNLTTYLKSDANRNILSYVFGATEATRLINKYISASPLPLALLERAKESGFYSNAATFLFGKFYGIEPTLLKSRWPNCEYALSGILGRNANIEDLDPETQSRIESLAGITSYYSDEPVNSLTSKLLDKMDSLTKAKTFITGRANAINQTVMRNLAVLPWQLGPFLSREYETSTSLSKEVRKQIVSIGLYYTNYENGKNIDYSKTPQAVEYLNEALASLQSIVQLLDNTRARDESRRRSWDSILKSLGYDIDKSSRDSVIETLIIFKAFVYYFSRYVTETAEGQRVANSAETRTPGLPPNTKVFRVHHYSDNTRSIIRNNITATTNEMWNTVVIEHPSPGTADSTISDKTQMFTEGRVSAGANWIYWPKQEVSGVIGLQFNPGLTLANKKVEVFTELNCQSSDVAAKLACHHLAKGIQKMYRGTLMMIGKNMKPYDRIIIADKYKSMAGPVEVESVVHHFNSEVGWITNVVPHAVCDANPGAAILQTAAMEATFEAVFNIIDFALDLATIATIVATAGAGTPLAIGEFGIKKGVRNVAKRLLSRSPARFIKDTLRAQIAAGGTVLKRVGGQFKNTLKKGQTLNSLREIYRQIGGPANSLLKSYMYAAGAEVVTHGLMKANVIPAYVEGTNSPEQLPVILSPLIYNGTAYTAGLEATDSVWHVGAFETFISMKQMFAEIERFKADIFEDL